MAGRGACHARASATLAHLSASAKSSAVVSISCVPSFTSIRSSRTSYDLAEALNKAPQRLPLLLLDGVEVALQTGARECALKISHKLVAEVIPGANRS